MKKFYTIQTVIPLEMVDKIAELFSKDGIFVNDLQEYTPDGLIVEMWIPKESVTKRTSNEMVGYFIGQNND